MKQSLKAFLFLFLFGTVALAQDGVLVIQDEPETKPSPTELTLQGTESEAGSEAFTAFYTKWDDLVAAVKENKTAEAAAILKLVVDQRKKNGIPKLTELSSSAIQLVDNQIAAGHLDSALMLANGAAELDPSLPAAYYSQARTHMARGIKGYPKAAAAALKGLLASQQTLVGKLFFVSETAMIVIATLILLGLAFATVMLIKYNHLLRHNAKEKYQDRNPALIDFLVWAFVFLPVLIFLGPLWLAPFWLMLLWGYSRPVEKVAAIVFLLAFVVAYPVLLNFSSRAKATADPSISPYITAFADGASPKAIRDFENYTTKHPEDKDAPILLAYLYKNDQRQTSAIRLLEKYIESNASDARAHNNLANIYYIQGQTDLALRLEQKAASLDTRNAVYQYNLSKIHRAKFNFKEAERLLSEARKVSAPVVRELEDTPQERLDDVIPTTKIIDKRIAAKAVPPVKLFLNPFTILSLLMLVMTFVMGNKKTFPRECIKCGKAFCKKCQSSAKNYEFCTQCLHLFVKKDGVSPASRKDKMEEIERYSRRRDLVARISSLLLPGVGGIYQNRTLGGLLILLLWILMIVILVFHSRFSGLTYFEPSRSVKSLALIAFVVMAVLYITANLALFKKSRA